MFVSRESYFMPMSETQRCLKKVREGVVLLNQYLSRITRLHDKLTKILETGRKDDGPAFSAEEIEQFRMKLAKYDRVMLSTKRKLQDYERRMEHIQREAKRSFDVLRQLQLLEE